MNRSAGKMKQSGRLSSPWVLFTFVILAEIDGKHGLIGNAFQVDTPHQRRIQQHLLSPSTGWVRPLPLVSSSSSSSQLSSSPLVAEEERTTATTIVDSDETTTSPFMTPPQAVKIEDIEIPTEWRGEVLQKLKNVIDPDLNADIVTLGFVQNLRLNEMDRTVSFDVELTTPACPVKEVFAADCKRLVSELSWTGAVNVTMTAQETVRDTPTYGLSQVGAVIAVSSCKGGVGKSTTAVNLAYSLQSLGATVGIFDVDVYGPSLPTMVTPDDDVVRFVGRQIAPLQRNGVRLMSFGYVNDGSAVMRGPMVTQLLDQLLTVTHWGALDYLVLDLPPGTGDIQLTLTQRLNITAAVIVTTPQELSFADVVRGIEMFDTVNVPCVAVVENMAYIETGNSKKKDSDKGSALDPMALKEALLEKLSSVQELQPKNDDKNDDDSTDMLGMLAEDLVKVVLEEQQKFQKENEDNSDDENDKHYIFGGGHRERLASQWGIQNTFSVPLLDRIAHNGDTGNPYVLDNPDTPQTNTYKQLASAVVKEVAKAKYQQDSRPSIIYNEEAHIIEMMQRTPSDKENSNDDNVESGETVHRLTTANLRRACRCAMCIEEMTGRQLLDPTTVPENIYPLRMSPTGNYALSVDWSDGHRSLYPYKQIKSVIEEHPEVKSVIEADTSKVKESVPSASTSTCDDPDCGCHNKVIKSPFEENPPRKKSPFEENPPRKKSPFEENPPISKEGNPAVQKAKKSPFEENQAELTAEVTP